MESSSRGSSRGGSSRGGDGNVHDIDVITSVMGSAIQRPQNDDEAAPGSDGGTLRVAHVGNSIQYYNDCPRLLEHMLKTRFVGLVRQDSCLRGGATLSSLLVKGNGMGEKFATEAARNSDGSYDTGAATIRDLLLKREEGAPWDVVIMNDHTQAPARLETRRATMKTLRAKYLPMFEKMATTSTSTSTTTRGPTVVFIQTAAYLRPANGSDDLGSFDEFTERLRQGYQEYADLFVRSGIVVDARVAPVGLAYKHIRQTSGDVAWAALYAQDGFHPSPLGTYLTACVLYCTIVGIGIDGGESEEREPLPLPHYDVSWWESARYMQPPDQEPLPLPTAEEVAMVQDAASHVCREMFASTATTSERM